MLPLVLSMKYKCLLNDTEEVQKSMELCMPSRWTRAKLKEEKNPKPNRYVIRFLKVLGCKWNNQYLSSVLNSCQMTMAISYFVNLMHCCLACLMVVEIHQMYMRIDACIKIQYINTSLRCLSSH